MKNELLIKIAIWIALSITLLLFRADQSIIIIAWIMLAVIYFLLGLSNKDDQ